MGDKWLLSASGTAKGMNLITYRPRLAWSTLRYISWLYVMRFIPFAVPLALNSHLSPTLLPGELRTKRLTAVVQTVTASVTVWLRVTIFERRYIDLQKSPHRSSSCATSISKIEGRNITPTIRHRIFSTTALQVLRVDEVTHAHMCIYIHVYKLITRKRYSVGLAYPAARSYNTL